MAGTTTVRIGSFGPGIDNRLERTQLESTNAQRQRLQALSAGDNIDINDAGGMRRRKGFVPRTSEGAAHSLWGDGGPDGYCVLDGDLVRLTEAGDGVAVSLLREGVGAAPMSFDRMPDGRVLFGSSAGLGIVQAGQAQRLCPPALAVEPGIALGAGGLRAGRYLVAFTRIEGGIEGPVGDITQVSVPDGGALVVSGLPGTPVRVYVSAPNGADPLLQVATSATSTTVAGIALDGIRCMTLRLAELPGGDIVRHHNARVLVAMGPYLLHSEPYALGLYSPGESYIPFPAPITVVRPVKGGVYVVADRTYWLSADLKADLLPLLPYGALPGSDGRRPDQKGAYWLSDRGLVMADEAGNVKNVQEARLSLAGGTRGATLLRERNGSTHILTARTGAKPLINPADGYMADELSR